MSLLRSFAVFIDYDNLTDVQKHHGILDVVTKALVQLPIDADVTRIMCNVRVYGGWYEDQQMTTMAQDVSVALQQEFPAILRLSNNDGDLARTTINAELAMAMLEEPGHHLFDTYRKKGKPSNIRVKSKTDVNCTDDACILPMMKKLLRNGRCPKEGCTSSEFGIVYRHEQKLVDTMLTCDLVHACNEGHSLIIVVSDDDDFLPPIRSALLRGTAVVRIHPKPSQKRICPPSAAAKLIELEL